MSELNKLKGIDYSDIPIGHKVIIMSLIDLAEAAEAKLAELEKQAPTGLLAINTGGGWRIAGEAEYIYASEHGFAASELFTRPAPAADLSELVPDEITHADAPELQEIASSARAIGIKGTYAGFAVGANWMRSAILRNIEGAK